MDERFTEMDRIVSFDDMMQASRPNDMAPTHTHSSSELGQTQTMDPQAFFDTVH
jgi:hypothetical protein